MRYKAAHGAARQQAGFTLIQISIILTLASLVMVAVLPSYQFRLTMDAATVSRMQRVLTALRQYQVAYGALPCPADGNKPAGNSSYGAAAAGGGTVLNCTGGSPAANYVDAVNHVAIGTVPVKSLGLSVDDGLDGYGRLLTYAVDTNATASCWTSPTLPGTITVIDNGAVINSVVALVSHGANGHGAFIPNPGSSGSATRLNAGSSDSDELTNAHVNASFASLASLTNFVKKTPTATFDDIVVYKSPFWNFGGTPQLLPQQVSVTPPANSTYNTGQVFNFTFTYSGIATVIGSPRLKLKIGSNTRYASYSSGSGTTQLRFSYTVLSADNAPYGISIYSPIDLNGGNITVANNTACATAFTPPGLSQVVILGQYIWVADSGTYRVEKFDMNGNWLMTYGGGAGCTGCASTTSCTCVSGTSGGLLSNPCKVLIDASQNVWVTDGNNAVVEFASNGTFIQQFSLPSGGDSIIIDNSGNFMITDDGNSQVHGYTTSGTNVYNFGSYGTGNGQFQNVLYMVKDSSGNVLITDASRNMVQKFDTSNNFLTKFGSSGTGNGQFNNLHGIALDNSGSIWLADSGNNRIQEFSSAGSYMTQFSAISGADLTDIAIDANNNIWSVDSNSRSITKQSPTGTVLLNFGQYGTGNGEFQGPQGITISYR